ncbi:MAG: 50S ribosomal protein L17, partial [Owenweeksia sp.]
KRINTTVAKAKALKNFVEPLITKSKEDNTHNRRVVFSYLRNKHAVSELFREVIAKVGDRPGGYTRIIKTGNRLGDNAEMCMIELVDFNEIYTNEKESKSKSTRRSRRGGGGAKKATDKPAEAKAPVKEEAPKEEEVKETKKSEETPAEETPKAEAKKEEAPAAEEESKEGEGDTKE